MLDQTLKQGIEKLVSVTQGMPDTALEQEWTWRAYSEGVRLAFFRTYEQICQLAAALGAERATQGPPMTAAQRALAQYHAAYRDWQSVLLRLEGDQLDRPPAEGEWTIRFTLGHIIHVKRQFFARTWYAVERARQGADELVAMPDDELEALVGGYEEFERVMDKASLGGLVAYYDELHQRILSELADVTAEELDAPSLWWEGYELPVRFRLHRFSSHLRQHTIQIEKTLTALGHSPNEVQHLWRMLYGALAEVEGVTIGAWQVGIEQRRAVAAEIAQRTGEIADVVTQ